MRTARSFLAAASSLAVLAVASPALADESAWVFVGGGALGWKHQQDARFTPEGTMIVDAGVGTTPDAPVIVGGLFRFQPILPNAGIDLSLLARLCTRGYQAGSFGVAIDAGGFYRPWGQFQTGGFIGSVSLGLPLGFTLMAQTEVGGDHTFSFGAVAGIDLLRLTLYRQILQKWWQNPSPAWKSASCGDGGPCRGPEASPGASGATSFQF